MAIVSHACNAPPEAGAEGADRLYRDYRPPAGGFDELLAPDGTLRPHWRPLIEGLSASPDAAIAQTWQAAERLLREYGVTYNVHGNPSGDDRPWRLDPIPLVIDAAEWAALEQGLIQRARLLNAILADLYGGQRLLTEGLLPPALVFHNPQFLRPVHGLPVPGGTWLHFIAIDLARGADGRWWVLSDRTQAPVGAGYALENRVVMARTVPELFRQCRVQRLAAFFQGYGDYLLSLVMSDEPRMVMLSPGPGDPTYFEHAYLARYLAMPLVEAADLTVRDRRVFVKTLAGLQPVHLIWRRVESDGCDPLELRADTPHGIPGLVQAVRAGTVVIVNALGSGVVESNAFMTFLPALCRELLGEDLLLPETSTWWCGHADGRRQVLDHLGHLVIRPTFASRSIMEGAPEQVIGARLDAAERAELAARIEARGADYVGQEILRLSTAPSWDGAGLTPRPVALRAYLAADGDGYKVMPGGLTRTSDHPDPRAVFMRQGDASKDTWLLVDGPVSNFSRLAQASQRLAPRRSGQDLPSRAADNLYWLGRYAERLEAGARLLRSLLLLVSGRASDADVAGIRDSLLVLMVELQHLTEANARRLRVGGAGFELELWPLMVDGAAANGLGCMLANLRRTATLVRERLSSDAWRILQELHDEADLVRAPARAPADALPGLNHLIRMLAAFSGMQMENMTRSLGWRLLDMGRRLERARNLAKLIAGLGCQATPDEAAHLDLLLQLADSTMTYRTRYLSEQHAALVVDLLLVDSSNPRAVAFQLDRLGQHLVSLPRAAESEGLSAEERLLARLRAKIELADLARLCEPTAKPWRRDLAVLMAEIEAELGQISDTVARAFFSHAERLHKSGPIWFGATS
jgi:uncharacterized circularly permuted ATP-grasp superfamily protein/uncharacterized alpha-E superfamily protein